MINSTPVDVIEIDAASNRSVEDARNILEKVQYAPLHGKYKIYIIDEVHMLTTEASNTLLKTLEEPPENVIFILATTESHKVLETIVSRCQRYDFRRITTADIVKRLTYIAKAENIKITEEALLTVAKNAAGGMRDAVALLDQLSVLGQNESITAEDVNELLGQISYDKIYEIVECISTQNTEKALSILNEIHDRGNEPSRVLTALIQYFRDMLILKSCSDKNIVFNMTKINEELFEKIKNQSEKFNQQTLIYFEDRLSYHFGKIKENTNKYMWAELCIIDLTSTPNVPTLAELTEKVAILEAKLQSGNTLTTSVAQPVFARPVVPPQKETLIVQSPKPVIETKPEKLYQTAEIKTEEKATKTTEQTSSYTSDEAADWAQITAEIKGPAKFFYSKLAQPIEINKHKIVIGFKNEGAAKQANDSAKKTLLQSAACKYYDVASIQVIIKVGTFEEKKNNLTDEQHPLVADIPQKQNIPQPKEPEKIEQEVSFEDNMKTTASNDFDDDYEPDSSSYGQMPQKNEKEEAAEKKREINNLDISDTAKNILELFNGKIAEN